jgi:GNAT superfamily N-acetyltransferase
MTELAIRPYTPADAEACTTIFDRAWHAGHPYAPRKIDAAEFSANTRNETILVAEMPGHGVAGFVSVYEPENFVHNLYVEPDLHGSGIGRALLARAVALAGGKASLKCQARAAQALAFYRHLGWTPGEEGETEIGRWVRMHSP